MIELTKFQIEKSKRRYKRIIKTIESEKRMPKEDIDFLIGSIELLFKELMLDFGIVKEEDLDSSFYTDNDKEFGNSFYKLIYKLIRLNNINYNDDFFKRNNIYPHYDNYCLAGYKRKSYLNRVYYDFNNCGKYRNYAYDIYTKFKNSLKEPLNEIKTIKVNSFYEAEYIDASFKKMFEENTFLLLDDQIDFVDKYGLKENPIKIVLYSNKINCCKNSVDKTIDFMLIDKNYNLLTIYPISSYVIVDKLNHIMCIWLEGEY